MAGRAAEYLKAVQEYGNQKITPGTLTESKKIPIRNAVKAWSVSHSILGRGSYVLRASTAHTEQLRN